jgi:hypothetical protein
MPSHRKRPRDPAQLAKLIVDIATGEVEDKNRQPLSPASEFARLGGLKGGQARADKLSAKRRSEIARKAAKTRWIKGRVRAKID